MCCNPLQSVAIKNQFVIGNWNRCAICKLLPFNLQGSSYVPLKCQFLGYSSLAVGLQNDFNSLNGIMFEISRSSTRKLNKRNLFYVIIQTFLNK